MDFIDLVNIDLAKFDDLATRRELADDLYKTLTEHGFLIISSHLKWLTVPIWFNAIYGSVKKSGRLDSVGRYLDNTTSPSLLEVFTHTLPVTETIDAVYFNGVL